MNFYTPPPHPTHPSSCWPQSCLFQDAKLLMNEPFLCCPWVSILSRSAGIMSLACGMLMRWTWALLSHLLPPGHTCHHTEWRGSLWPALAAWYSQMSCGKKGRGCSRWVLRQSWLPCSLVRTALRKAEAICRAAFFIPPDLFGQMLGVPAPRNAQGES